MRGIAAGARSKADIDAPLRIPPLSPRSQIRRRIAANSCNGFL